MSESKICVVIVTWNSVRDIGACLNSLRHQNIPLQIIVIDNASSDATVSMVREYPEVELIVNSRNRGFAAAGNQGADKCQSPWLLLLNPDTIVPPNTLLPWIQEAQQTPGLGASGSKLLNVDGSIQPSVRRLPTLGICLVLLLKLHRLLPSIMNKYLCADFNYQEASVVSQVMGAALLTPATVYRRLGGLDADYHLWFEEVDYCTRLAKVGLKVWYFPAVCITHVGGSSFIQTGSLWRQWEFTRSLLRYSAKYFGWKSVITYLAAPFSLIFAVLTNLVPFSLRKKAMQTWFSS